MNINAAFFGQFDPISKERKIPADPYEEIFKK